MVIKSLDFTGLRCPMPVLKTKKELKTLNPGDMIEVIADDVGAKKDIPAMLNKTGNELVDLREDNGNLVFVIKKA